MAAVLFKVALLTLKTAAKPLAKQFENLVMSHPVMRQKVIGAAQASRQAGRQRLDLGSQAKPGYITHAWLHHPTAAHDAPPPPHPH